jgi:hypothetical protein
MATNELYLWNEIEQLENELAFYRKKGYNEDSGPVQQAIQRLKELYELVEMQNE